MNKNLQRFGKILKDLRIKKDLTLREACRLAHYDPSNWSKIERGRLSPPTDRKVLARWAKIVGLTQGTKKFQEFLDEANLAKGIIPQDIFSQKNTAQYLPAFIRTLRNQKPTKEEIDRLIELIRKAW